MSIYLETNALRKLIDYTCDEQVYTSIFSIFELLSGITPKEFNVRKACLRRISEQEIEVCGPMVDEKLARLFDKDMYNPFAYDMIWDVFQFTINAETYEEYAGLRLSVTEINGQKKEIVASEWLKQWDDNIADLTQKGSELFEDEDKLYIKDIYQKRGLKGLANHFWNKLYDARNDENRLAHVEGFLGREVVEGFRQETEKLFSKYNFKLFIIAQAVILSKAYFIDGNTQDRNNISDLLHLLYLEEGDRFVSNDKIYQKIPEFFPDFNLINLQNERNLLELFETQ